MEPTITTLAARPELARPMGEMPETWQEFVLEDLVGRANHPRSPSGALVPVQCSVAHGYAVYVEPNVWVRHRV